MTKSQVMHDRSKVGTTSQSQRSLPGHQLQGPPSLFPPQRLRLQASRQLEKGVGKEAKSRAGGQESARQRKGGQGQSVQPESILILEQHENLWLLATAGIC